MKYRIKYLSDAVSNRRVVGAYLLQYYESTARDFFATLKKRVLQICEKNCSLRIMKFRELLL